MSSEGSDRKLAEAVRDACLDAARQAYEDASIRGLCHEGAWECAVGAIRSVDLVALAELRREAKEEYGRLEDNMRHANLKLRPKEDTSSTSRAT